jgi:hypothetical protein
MMWLMPAIPATWEVEIRGSQFEASQGKKKLAARPYLSKRMWTFMPVISAMWGA